LWHIALVRHSDAVPVGICHTIIHTSYHPLSLSNAMTTVSKPKTKRRKRRRPLSSPRSNDSLLCRIRSDKTAVGIKLLLSVAAAYSVFLVIGSASRDGLRRRLRSNASGGGPTSLRHEPFPQSPLSQEQEVIQHPLDAYKKHNSSIGGDTGEDADTKDGHLTMIEEEKVLLNVPKFWEPPVLAQYGGIRKYLGNYGSRLMTPQEAKSVGSVIIKDLVDGTQEELHTILVLFASFRDWMCPHSVERMFERAAHPERIRVAIIDQILDGDISCSAPIVPCEEDSNQALCKYSSQVEAMTLNANLSTGPIFARHLGYRMYRGEYFVVQSDAHVQFAAGWDVDVIDQWKSTGNEMAVLTSYVSRVQGNVDEETGERLSETRPLMCESNFSDEGFDRHLEHGEQPEYKPDIEGSPQLEPFWGAGFSFARGHFVVNIPYDLHIPLVFMGEEASIGIRGFTYGYDYYAPERNILYHYYERPENPNNKRESDVKVPKYWDAPNYDDTVEMRAMVRLNDIIHMSPPRRHPIRDSYWSHVEELKYGLGKVRTPELFFDTFGIHRDSQVVEKNLCMFVASKSMHNFFVKRLREDGMGIDYEKLDGFQYKNKWPKNWWWWYHGDNPNEEDAYLEPMPDSGE